MLYEKFTNFAIIIFICLTAVNSTLLAEPVLSADIDYAVSGDLFINGDWDNPVDPPDYDFVNFLPGSETSGCIYLNAGGEAHLYGGTFNTEFGAAYEGWFEMLVVDGVLTVHGENFWVGGELIPENQSTIQLYSTVPGQAIVPAYPVNSYGNFNLSWEHQDGTIYSIWIDSDYYTTINLSDAPYQAPNQTPEINVYPESLAHDYGDIETGQSKTVVVQIVNSGQGNLNISSITISGSDDFVITTMPIPTVIGPDEIASTDIEITFTPSTEALVQATLTIASDDADEPSVAVILSGKGVIVEVPVEQQIQDALNFYNTSIGDGTILGYAPRASDKAVENRVKALGNMLEAAGKLIEIGETEIAIEQLQSIAKKTDGQKSPPDFVIGDGVTELNQKVNDLIAALSS